MQLVTIIKPALRRWRWVLLSSAAVVVLSLASVFVILPLCESDKVEAARALVAWIVEGRSVLGFGETYPDARWMPGQKRFIVVCDFIPLEVSLSDDPRVHRISAKDQEAAFERHRYDATDYIVINVKSESGSRLLVELSNHFGWLAGHGYSFEFHRTIWGLRATGEFLWVS